MEVTHIQTPTQPPAAARPPPYTLKPTKFSGEDILFCIDVGPESAAEMKVGVTGGRPYTRLEGMKQAIVLFINAKLTMNSDHRFGFACLAKSAAWLKKEFSSDVDFALSAFRTLAIDSSASSHADLTQLFRAAAHEAKKSRAQGRIFRVILLYSRSSVPPQFQWTLPQKLFTLDVIYLHDKPGPDNCPQKVYDALVEALDTVSEYEGYIYESGQGLPRTLFRYMCVLLSHPQQRITQDDNDVPKSFAKKSNATDSALVEDVVMTSQ